MASKLLVNEIFGPTVQGEGPSLGTPCAFLRVAACNLSCVWCDTYYTWDWQRVNKEDEVHPMAPADAAYLVKQHLPPSNEPTLVISGGEPMLQQDALAKTVMELPPSVRIEVETAGTIAPKGDFAELVDAYNCSPKLEHSGNSKAKRYVPAALDALMESGKVQGWKFVVQQPSDFDEIQQLIDTHGLFPIYVMPEGVTKEELEEHASNVIEEVIQRGWKITPRLHIQLWGNERGH